MPIIAVTDFQAIYQKMSLYRGILPLMMPKKFADIHKWNDMINLALKEAKKHGLIAKGDRLVMLAGIPFGKAGGTNSIRILTVT